MKRNNQIFRMVFSALCLAVGIAIKNLTFFVPIGIPILKISFDGPAFRLAAVLFGPLYGAIVGGLADFIGFFLTNKSGNAWIPLLTVTYALNICLVGYLWKLLKDRKASRIRYQYLSIVGLILFLGTMSLWLGAKKKPELLSLDSQKQAIAAFETEYEKNLNRLGDGENDKESAAKLMEVKALVEKSKTLISERQLQNAVKILEDEETKAFEATISKETKVAFERIKGFQEELEQDGSLDKAGKEERKQLYQLASSAIKSGENQMKAVRDSRRQMQGSIVVILVGIIAAVIYLINRGIAKNQEIKGIADNFLQMFVSIFIPSILFNWVNTFILFNILFQNQKKNLFMFGVFRSAVNLVEVYYNTLIVLFLVALLNPLLNKRGIYPFGEKSKKQNLKQS